MKILFICLSGVVFDVETPKTQPLGGTESAVSYLSLALTGLGHEITIMSKRDEAVVVAGVNHIPLSEDAVVGIDPDIVIVPSGPQAIPDIQKRLPNAKIVLWNHMQPDQPAVRPMFDPEVRKLLKNIVYVSQHQKEVFDLDGIVINNGISPLFENMFSSAEEIAAVKQCKGAYASTPYRGLALLAHLKELPVDVFSSMKVYQLDDEPYKAMFDLLAKNECVILKGSVSQKELAESYRSTAFFVYPSIFQECDSIAVKEALAAGLRVVTTDRGFQENEYVDRLPYVGASVEDYAKLLRKNLNFYRTNPVAFYDRAFKQVQYVNQNFTWAIKAKEWDQYLANLA